MAKKPPPKPAAAEPQDKLRTSREIYDQIRWDPRFDPAAFVIGYETRFAGMQEIALPRFEPGGDIPWHRIWYVRRGETHVWDRRTRIDLLGSPGAAPAAESTAPAIEGDALPIHHYDPRRRQWVEVPAHEGPGPAATGALTVVTYNVLIDTHERDRIQTARRVPALLAILKRSGADLIGLQEVEQPFLESLLAQEWVQKSYFASDGPEGGTVVPYGQILLSRLPLRGLRLRAFSATKRLVTAVVAISPDRDASVAVAHLTSDRAKNAAETRATQLRALHEELPADRPAIVLGDLNFGDDDREGARAIEAFTDAWPALHPGDPGYTYDPATNTLAAITTSSGRSSRFDRVLSRAPDGILAPESVELLGRAAIGGKGSVFPSDHFGVRAVLAMEARARSPRIPAALAAAKPVHRSAVAILPPERAWPPIQAIRSKHDKHVDRWMPHINLLYGFLPETSFAEAAPLIAEALRAVPPFTVTLGGFDRFEHRASSTVWLRPQDEPAGALAALQAALFALFPQCDEQGRASAAGFTPHLSVAQFDRVSESTARAAEWGKRWSPLSFTVDAVKLISRRGDDPFEVRCSIALGTGAVTYEGGAPTGAREALLGTLRDAVARAGGALHVLGSVRLGTDDAHSDLDVLAMTPAALPRAAFFERVQRELVGAIERARVVEEAFVPALKLVIGGAEVDVSHAALPEGVALAGPVELDRGVIERLDPSSRRAILGALEADALLVHASTRFGADAYRALLRSVKAWARARGVLSNGLGFLGGFSWAVLAAWICARDPGAPRGPARSLLARFFEVFAAWEWPRPVSLLPEGDAYAPEGPRDRMPILTTVAPFRNSARNVTRSTLAVLARELGRARQLAASGDDEALFAPVDPFASGAHRGYLLITITAASPGDLDACLGFVDGRLIGLLLDLERSPGEEARPYPGACLVVGLSSAAAPREAMAAFEASFSAWRERPEGSELRVTFADRADRAQAAFQSSA